MREWRTSGSVGRAPGNRCLYPEPDCLQRPLLRRSRFRQQLRPGVIAPRKAWRLWQGESPWRVRASHPPVARLASLAESQLSTRRTRGAPRRQRLLEAAGVTAPPAGLGQLRHGHGGRRGCERSRRPQERHRCGQVEQGRRRPQAVACRTRAVAERGKPQTLLSVANLGSWSPAPEAPQGQPGPGPLLEPPRHGGPGDRQAAQSRPRERPPETDGVSYHA